MISQPCRLLFLAVLLAAGFFNSTLAQNTVQAEQVPVFICDTDSSFGAYVALAATSSECEAIVEPILNSSNLDQWQLDSPWAPYNTYSSRQTWKYWTYTGSGYDWRYKHGYFGNQQQGTELRCPASHPIDNGDGTCSTDTAHEEFCQGLAAEGHSYWDTQDGLSCAVVDEGNPQNYACAYQRDDIGVGFGGSEPQFEFTATGETCSGEVGGGGTGGSDPLDPSTPINGDDLGGGSAPGTDPTPPANDEGSNYLGEKFAFETRTQTGELLDGMAEAVNQRNLNHDKNSQFIVEGLSDLAKVNKEIGSDIERAVRASGGSGGGTGDGDPAGWGNEEDVEIGAVDCLPDPITGRCTNWAPLTEQELPEKIYNLDDEIAQFDEYTVTASCPDTLDMNLSFGVFDFNSKPVCDTLGGVRYILLALAYFLVARVVTRSMA